MEITLGRAIAVTIFLVTFLLIAIVTTNNLRQHGLIGAADPMEEGLEKRTLKLNGQKQDFYLYTETLQTDKKRAAILVLQGSGVTALSMREAGFEAIADREGIAVIYLPLQTPTWLLQEAIGGEDTSVAFDVDTVNFVHQMLEELIVNVKLDPSRIYLTGFSDGGVATFYFMCELSHLVAAVATVAAAMPIGLVEECTPERAIPLMMLNGTADSRVRFSGGIFGDPNQPQGLEMASAFDTATFWRQANGCGEVDQKSVLDDKDPTDSARVWTQTWEECDDLASVHFITLLGGGHGWPGASLPVPTTTDSSATLQSSTGDISGAEFIWSFFREKSLPPSQANEAP